MMLDKKYHLLGFLAIVTLVASCQKPYEKKWGLEVDSYAYNLTYEDGEFPLFVYCSGDWSASFDTIADWIKINEGTASGSGNGVIRISYRYNEDVKRSVNLVVTSGPYSKKVAISQDYDSIKLVVE